MTATHKARDASAPERESQWRKVLRAASLRPTRPRLALARALFDGPARHVSAEALCAEMCETGEPMALSTVYNIMRAFTKAGLLRPVPVAGARLADTCMTAHHHMLNEATGELVDIPYDAVRLDVIPPPPDGAEIVGVDVLVRVRPRAKAVGDS